MNNDQLNEQDFNQEKKAQIENAVKEACETETPPMPKPDNNLALAIFTTVCCCLPLGIVAIIKSSRVDNLYATKNYEAAIAEAESSKKFSTYGMVAGMIFGALYSIVKYIIANSAML